MSTWTKQTYEMVADNLRAAHVYADRLESEEQGKGAYKTLDYLIEQISRDFARDNAAFKGATFATRSRVNTWEEM